MAQRRKLLAKLTAQQKNYERSLQSHDALLDGELDEPRRGLDAELLHHAVFVERDGSRRDLEDVRDLLHRPALGEQLQHLALTRAQLVAFLGLFGAAQERVENVPRGQRRDVRASQADVLNGLEQLRGRRILQEERGS